jgi:hypothetical protein
MTLRKWITFASAAAVLAGVGACKDSGGGSSVGTRTSPEGRRSDTVPRARDAGSDMTTGSGTSATSPSSPTSPSTTSPGSPTTPPPSSSGSSSDTKR